MVASSLYVATTIDDISDAAGPGRKCVLQLTPLGNPPARSMSGRFVRLSNWECAAFRDGGDFHTMVFGIPPDDSALMQLPIDMMQPRPSMQEGLPDTFRNQAVYIQRPEHEARRPW